MTGDPWADWLLHRRDGGDAATREATAAALARIRDRLLADVALVPGDHVLDVGCGDGLVAHRAAQLVGPTGHVVFSDRSIALLDICRRAAADAGYAQRCEFVASALPDLAELPSGAHDAVTIRSVLIYVADKPGSLRSAWRVLRPGGRLGLFEPINDFGVRGTADRLWGLAVDGAQDLAHRVAVAARAGATEHDTMLGFDERDLFAWALDAGFVDVAIDYRAEIAATTPASTNLDAFLATAPNPLAPTYGELLEAALAPEDRPRLRDRLARALAEGDVERRAASVHLRARRPD